MTQLDLLKVAQYTLPQAEKEALLLGQLNALTEYHHKHCQEYARILQVFHGSCLHYERLNDLPYFPVALFKEHELVSVPGNEIVKTLTSSGTTGAQPSKIFLDRESAMRQTQALAAVMTTFLGKQRLPMLIIDTPSVLKNPATLTARGAGILGMFNFGKDHLYALDDNMDIDMEAVTAWIANHQKEPILIFGFTFMIWKHFIQKLERHPLKIPQGIVIHGGGWKKLLDESVSNTTFKDALKKATGISRCHGFYGMVEQIGSVFVECEEGNLHCPNFADVIVRDPYTWEEAPVGRQGVLQVLSTLPTSYPGHSLLTEDLGHLSGIDDCPCGRKGKRFHVSGRIPQAEIRGCSDTYAVATAQPEDDPRMNNPQKHRVDISGSLDEFLSRDFHVQHPFDPLLIQFCDELSKALFACKEAQPFPDLQALAFWLRKGQVLQLKNVFQAYNTDTATWVPRGLAFHIPPSNVDTMFVYSWILSLLVGNGNIIRIPSKKTPVSTLLFKILQEQLQKECFSKIAETTYFIEYGHDTGITEAISRRASLRIIWGGDSTIETIRAIPMNPLGKEIVFADRFSYSVIHASAYLGASNEQHEKLAAAFFNDVYWFDQNGCSSPLIVFWVGEDSAVQQASHQFYESLQGVINKKDYHIPLASVTMKEAFLHHDAISKPITGIRRLSNELSVVKIDKEGETIRLRDHCRNGMLYHAQLGSLRELERFVIPKDQTLTHFGFPPEHLQELAKALKGKGIDRIVPIGQALNFSHIWDGYNLLQELTRVVVA